MTSNRTALVTGSTSGIGKAFADKLAAIGYDLILVSKNKDKLNKQAQDLKENYPIQTSIIDCDLTQADSAQFVYERVLKLDKSVDLLINNAGFNECGSFLETNAYKEIDMIHLHIIFTTQMMKLFLPTMVKNNYGRILNVGSTGSYIPCPYDSVYSATKAYILHISKALNAEFKNTGVSITTLCPGSTKTEFAYKANMEHTLLFKAFVMSADKVANIGFNALIKRKEVVIAGVYNKSLVVFSFLLPNKFVNYLSKKMLKNRKSNEYSKLSF